MVYKKIFMYRYTIFLILVYYSLQMATDVLTDAMWYCYISIHVWYVRPIQVALRSFLDGEFGDETLDICDMGREGCKGVCLLVCLIDCLIV